MNSHPEWHTLFTREQIESVVDRLAADITAEYQDKNPIIVGILKGVFSFMADLVRRLDFPLEVEFIRLSSYGNGQQTTGMVKVVQGLSCSIKDRHVLIVEDIIDTGITIAFLMDYLENEKPASLKLCALLDKPSRRRKLVKTDYLGFEVPDKFMVGYGLDYNEQYRNLPDICYLEE
jgi:hypoxanthine phosphoribosyltransferase